MCMHESRGVSREAGIAVDKVLPIASFTYDCMCVSHGSLGKDSSIEREKNR